MPKLDSATVKKAYKGVTPAVRIYKGTQLVWPSGDILATEVRTQANILNWQTPTSLTPPYIVWFTAPASGKVLVHVFWEMDMYGSSSSTGQSNYNRCTLRIRPDTLVAAPVFDAIVVQTQMDDRVRHIMQLITGLTPYRAYNAELLLTYIISGVAEYGTVWQSMDILMA